ncbi:hypothetical protein ACFPRL_28955 [Pseudoclavibacter helvolus]
MSIRSVTLPLLPRGPRTRANASGLCRLVSPVECSIPKLPLVRRCQAITAGALRS